jgi:predicted CXXCH cytochrome family protein
MKRHTFTALGVAAAGCLTAVGLADIVGSAHDFSGTSWAGGEICKPCHTPHFGDTEIGFLWAHTMSEQVYSLYDGSETGPGGVDELDQFSRMCLSCHDGTIALNDFHNGGGAPTFIPDSAKIGGDGNLQDDHPIGVTAEYPVGGNSQFQSATLTPSGFWGFGGNGFPEVPLFPFEGAGGEEQVVSCSSCHTPHARSGVDWLLRKSNAGSDLCLTCHIK